MLYYYVMDELLCFAAVEFVDDPAVAGWTYWYLSDNELNVGDSVRAPLGRHNTLQTGVVRKVTRQTEYTAPYPLDRIKKISEIMKNNADEEH